MSITDYPSCFSNKDMNFLVLQSVKMILILFSLSIAEVFKKLYYISRKLYIGQTGWIGLKKIIVVPEIRTLNSGYGLVARPSRDLSWAGGFCWCEQWKGYNYNSKLSVNVNRRKTNDRQLGLREQTSCGFILISCKLM